MRATPYEKCATCRADLKPLDPATVICRTCGARYCPTCGKEVDRTCPLCKAKATTSHRRLPAWAL